MIIYRVTNTINGKVYIGQTQRSIKLRWSEHCRLTKSKHRSAIRCAIAQYSPAAFKVETIDTAVTIEELNEKEVFWIKTLDTMSPNGYNLDSGGKNRLFCAETKQKMSMAKRGKSRLVSEEERKNRSAARIGKPLSEKHKKALKAAKRFKIPVKCLENNTIYNCCGDAAKALNLNPNCIDHCIKGKMKQTKDYHFEIANAKY